MLLNEISPFILQKYCSPSLINCYIASICPTTLYIFLNVRSNLQQICCTLGLDTNLFYRQTLFPSLYTNCQIQMKLKQRRNFDNEKCIMFSDLLELSEILVSDNFS